MADDIRQAALDYHRLPKPGKLAIVATKPLANQHDLALAYTPGVAAACLAIVAEPGSAADYTARANLVGVVTNVTAVLGLGAIGPLAAKPVMEGKAVLFKTFAGIDVFDIEINETDPDKLVDIIASLEPTFGAINLEDIKAPECFEVERKLRQRMRIPVFHDDQHGTSITVAAAILNGLRVVEKPLDKVRLVTSGAGAAALACLDLLVDMGLPIANITVTDIVGVVYEGRTELMDPRKARYAKATTARTLGEIIGGADVFLGLSAPGVLKPEMVARMADRPPRRLPPAAHPVRLPLRPGDEAGVRDGAQRSAAAGLCRGRGGEGAARRPDGGRRKAGAADPDRPPPGRHHPHPAARPQAGARRRLRAGRSPGRSALPGILGALSPVDGAQGRLARPGPHRGALRAQRDRRADGPPRRRRGDDLRHRRRLCRASAQCARHHRAAAGGEDRRCRPCADPAARHLLPLRHPGDAGAERRADRRDHAAGGR